LGEVCCRSKEIGKEKKFVGNRVSETWGVKAKFR